MTLIGNLADPVNEGRVMWGTTAIHKLGDISRPKGDFFFDHLNTGEGLSKDSPILRLRRKVQADATATKKSPRWIMHALAIKAWNAFRRGEDLKLLKFTAGGANPEPFPEAI